MGDTNGSKPHKTFVSLDLDGNNAELATYLHDAANKLTAIIPNLDCLLINAPSDLSEIQKLNTEVQELFTTIRKGGTDLAERRKAMIQLRERIRQILSLLEADQSIIARGNFKKACYRDICSATVEFEKLVDNAAFPAKSESPAEPLEEVEMGNFITSIVSIFQGVFPNINFHFDLNLNVKANIFPDTLKRALENLIMNSIQAMDESRGDIYIRLKEVLHEEGGEKESGIRSGRYCQLEIEDNGSGITPVLLKRIAKQRVSTKSDGSGLGLISVRDSVRIHRGYLTIESEVGRYTRVSTLIPSSHPQSGVFCKTDVVEDEQKEKKVG